MKIEKSSTTKITKDNFLYIRIRAVFTVESILKILAFGVRNYFRDGWNRFDFITVVGEGIYLFIMTLLDNTQLVRILRTKKYELIEMGTKELCL